MEKHTDYESVRLEIVYLDASDVIATSTPADSDDSNWNGRFDLNGWT